MTTQEIAIKYGVPMPEMCKALDWQNETFFYWIDKGDVYPNGRYELVCNARKDRNIVGKISFSIIDHARHTGWQLDVSDIGKTIFPAPQMHEIASIIPEKYLGMYSGRIGDISINSVQSDSIDVWIDFDMYVDIKNHHYAQAYAELYLKLKEKNLLTTQ